MVSIILIVTLLLAMDTIKRTAYCDTGVNSTSLSHVNPHWDKTQCGSCHDDSPTKGSPGLRATDDESLCLNCHKDDVTHIYIHPVGLEIPKARKKLVKEKWGSKLRLDSNDRVTCQSCHDLLDQCLPKRSYQAKVNPRFLRDGPYPNRYSICYRCHDSSKYERRNSHDQIAKNGMLKMEKCRLCHVVDVKKKVHAGIERDLSQYPILNGLNEDRTLLCIRCHRKIDHPSSAFRVRSTKKYRHLVKIEKYQKKTLEEQNKLTGIELPIEPQTGRIYCATCHQPHQPGVFAGETIAPVTMKNHRLRDKPICKHCHDIYGSITDTGKQ